MYNDSAERFMDKSVMPELIQIEKLLGKKAFSRLNGLDSLLKNNYDVIRELKFPFGNNYGWSYKYSSKNKLLCYVFFEKDSFTVTITIGKNELKKLYEILDELIPKTKQLWENRYPCGDGGWIHYRIDNDNELTDIYKLICIKKKPKHELEKLACSLGRNDEEPNIKLAEYLCEHQDKIGIAEIVDGFNGKEKAVANDCIKVLYEIGSRKPELIAEYTNDFISHLLSKNNRLAWGSMTALACIADINAKAIYEKIDIIKKAYETGSVITIDNSMTVFAKLCKADRGYEAAIFPLLIKHLSSCRPKEAAQHAERIIICVNKENAGLFFETLEIRKNQLTISQIKRIEKLMKKVQKECKYNIQPNADAVFKVTAHYMDNSNIKK